MVIVLKSMAMAIGILLILGMANLINADGCFVPDTTWDAEVNHGTNNVTTKEECQAICKNASACRGFTHYNATASPRANFCETFPTIPSSIPCSNCVSGPSSCFCSGPYTCSLAGQAVLGLEFGVVSEEDCAQLCWETEGCSYYSYYSVESSPLQLACAKLSECNDRTSDPNVVSGPSDCNGSAVVSESYPMCFNVGTSWVHNTSVTIPEVPSVEECQSLCLQSSECIAFTWHKESEAFGSKLCELFPTIGDETSGECADCVSGPKSCTCSNSVACSFDDEFLIDILTEIATEEECQDLCAREPKCSWYTWYSFEGRPFSQACALLSECSERKGILDGSVKSGLAECPALNEHCANYNVLDSFTRHYWIIEHNFCSGGYCCDQEESSTPDWKGAGWYRIKYDSNGVNGTKIVDDPVNPYHCGTARTGWLSGGHPLPSDGVVTRKVCFSNGINDCWREVDVDVLNCNNAYYVYYLFDVPQCFLGYCTE